MFIRLADALGVEMWELFDFGHRGSRRDLKSILNKIAGEAGEEQLRLMVKVLRAIMR
jgi:hypothetical protein